MTELTTGHEPPLLDLHPPQGDFLADALAGLGKNPKAISPMYFYDRIGSELFDQICTLAEYYPTRTEEWILQTHGRDIAEGLGPSASLIELGSGSSRKSGLLLRAATTLHSYVPIDIARTHVQRAASLIAARFGRLRVLPVCADFTGELKLPRATLDARSKHVWFPGSTIGNFGPAARARLLATIRRLCLPQGGGVVVGVDLRKDHARLERAYNDERGVTAAFNLNLLQRMNRELGSDFDLAQFRHHAFYNTAEHRIEMHLESLSSQTVRIGDHSFEFDSGETICTEYSYKFTVESFVEEAAPQGFTYAHHWTDPEELFAVIALRADPALD